MIMKSHKVFLAIVKSVNRDERSDCNFYAKNVTTILLTTFQINKMTQRDKSKKNM